MPLFELGRLSTRPPFGGSGLGTRLPDYDIVYEFGVKGQSRKNCVDLRSQNVGCSIQFHDTLGEIRLSLCMPTPHLSSLVALWSALGGNSPVAHTHLRTQYGVNQINTSQSNFQPHSYPCDISTTTKHSLSSVSTVHVYCICSTQTYPRTHTM